MHITSIGFMQE